MAIKQIAPLTLQALINHLHGSWTAKRKATHIKYNLTSRDVVFGIMVPTYGKDDVLDGIEGVISGHLKFSFRAYVTPAGTVAFTLDKMARFIPRATIAHALHRVLLEQERRFRTPGGGPARGIHLKAISLNSPINGSTDIEGYTLGLKSGLFHKDLCEFGKKWNVAGRIS